jgi:hypothetical protein
MTSIINITNLSKINLGTSETNNKEYILKFENECIITDIIIWPFGSNKMRYQYPNMFQYELYGYDGKCVTLKIKRHDKPNCPVTSIFFPEKGWTINLQISIKIKYNDKSFTKDDILYMIPYNYGTVKLSYDEFQFKKIGIVMPLFGRFEYTKECLTSLSNTDLDDCTLILIDESITKDVNDDKIMTNNFINNFHIEGVDIIKIFKNAHGNMHDSILVGLDILEQHCDMLMTIDSDTLHKKDWIYKTLQLYKKLTIDHNNGNILVTGFNTPNHEISHSEADYAVKKTVGGCHLCFSSETYRKLLRFGMISNKWDTHAYGLINKHNGIICTTVPSVIEHIGQISSVREGGRYDRTTDF